MLKNHSGVMQRLAQHPQTWKRKGAVLSLESMMYIALLLIFAAIGIGMFSMRESAKIATAKTELDQIRTATIEYNGYQITSSYPSDPAELLNELPASDSTDGMAHGPFLQPSDRWKTGSDTLADPWGGSYEYVMDGNQVSAVQTDGGGHLEEPLVVYVQNVRD